VPSGSPISEAHVKLVFVKDGNIVRAPEAVLRRIGEVVEGVA